MVLAFRFLTSDEVAFMELSFRKDRLSKTYRTVLGDVFCSSETYRPYFFVGHNKLDGRPLLHLKSLIDEKDSKSGNYACFDEPFAITT